MSPLYELENVSFDFGRTRVLDIAALTIEENTITAVVGPNGAGKSTLLNLLAFLIAPAGGSVRFRGRAVAVQEAPILRRRVGLVQQNPYLLRRSVIGNIEVGLALRGVARRVRASRARAMLEALGLGALAERPAAALSGGEAQKVAIGRILVLEPEVLLLDEPFTHLDRDFLGEMEDLIRTVREHRARAVVFSTHDQLRARLLAGSIRSLANGAVVPTSLINLFRGRQAVSGARFDTGRISIAIPEGARNPRSVAIDPAHIVLSKQPLDSSMQNRFEGRITGLTDRHDQVEITVEAGERFQVLVSHAALADQKLALGDTVWLSFKSSAVQVL
jgi:molybdopterin-binding protein